MDDSTKTMMLTIGTGIAKKVLLGAGAAAASHGLIAGNQIETFVSVGMVVIGMGWSFWNDYGRAIVLSKLEVLKAQSLAQAAKLQKAGIPQPTVTEIAAQHPTLTPADVAKVAPIVVKVLIAAFLLSGFLFAPPAFAKGHRAKHHRAEMPAIVMEMGGRNDPLRSLNDKIKQDITTRAITSIQDQTNPASNALQELADFISGDVANAADLAISIPDMLDGNGQICLDEMKKASTVFQANPVPSMTDKQGLASALERIRLLAMTANRICQLPACTQVFADASGALAQLAPLKMPAVPNVHDICSLIPTVAVATPTRKLVPVVAAAPVVTAPAPTAAAAPLSTPADTAAPK